jgi:hypothetical protein
LKQIIKYIDDILFTLGVISLSFGGFLIYIPVGLGILGICLMTYSFMFAKAAARGGGK